MKTLFRIVLLILLIIVALFFLRSCESTKPVFDEVCESLGLGEFCGIGSIGGGGAYTSHYDLCPPDGVANISPRFFPMKKEGDLFVTYGNFSNQHDEIFSIKVSGKKEEAIKKYTADLKVCADVVLLSKSTQGNHEETTPTDSLMLTDRSDSSDENLFIELDFAAKGVSLISDKLKDVIDRLYSPILPDGNDIYSFRRLEGNILVPGGLDVDVVESDEPLPPPQIQSLNSFFSSPESDHAIDFIIDPEIGRYVFHDYYSRCRKYASFTVKTNSGKSSGYMYRDGSQIRSRTNITNSTSWKNRSMYAEHGSSKHRRYDAGVYGEVGVSHYDISGTWVTGSGYDSTNKRRGYAYGC